MTKSKVSIIGAGSVGGATAQLLLEKEIAQEIVLLDIITGLPQGKALDLAQARPLYRSSSQIRGTGDFKETKNSSLVIITSGQPRKPGMSREDLLLANAQIVQEVTKQIVRYSKDPIIIVVTNPLDAMAYLVYRVSELAPEKVLGMAGALDSMRLKHFIAEELKISPEVVQAMVLGSHGDTMVPLISWVTAAGIPAAKLMAQDRLEAILQKTKNAGREIVELLKTQSTSFAPARAIVEMVEAILKDKKKILPSSVLAQGEYGLKDIFIGLPAKLGRSGVEKIIEVELSPQDQEALEASAQGLKKLCQIMDEKIL